MSEDGAKESNIERNMETEIPIGLIVQKVSSAASTNANLVSGLKRDSTRTRRVILVNYFFKGAGHCDEPKNYVYIGEKKKLHI